MPAPRRTGRSRVKQTPTGRLVLQVETHTTRTASAGRTESRDRLGEPTTRCWLDARPEDLRALAAGELEPLLWVVPSRIHKLASTLNLVALGAVAANVAVAVLAYLGAQMILADPAKYLAAALAPLAFGQSVRGAIATYKFALRRMSTRTSSV